MADETWIGGGPINRHRSRDVPVRIKPGHGNLKTDKTPVRSLINAATGEVRSGIVPAVTAATLRKAINEQVDMAGSALWTDGWKGYLPIDPEFIAHHSVNHIQGEYVRGEITTNQLEGYFSQLKRLLDGTHHQVSVEPPSPVLGRVRLTGTALASCLTRLVCAG